MSPAENRILRALRARPMTATELAEAAFVDTGYLRRLLRRMDSAGVIRPGRQAPRKHVKGASPRYWEAA